MPTKLAQLIVRGDFFKNMKSIAPYEETEIFVTFYNTRSGNA